MSLSWSYTKFFWEKKITKEERERDFCWVEGMPFVEHAEIGQFPQYTPTPMSQVKDTTKLSLRDITQAKRKHKMYPIQRLIINLFGSNKNPNA